MDAFLTHCPACDYEIRNVRSSSSAREFTEKLEKIESKQMHIMPPSKSVMKKVFGRDLRDKDEVEEARRKFEYQKEQEKVALIINYPVPNTKEDLLEFMIMVTSNINVKEGIDDSVTKAWIEKLDQVYQLSLIHIYTGSERISQIVNIYFLT